MARLWHIAAAAVAAGMAGAVWLWQRRRQRRRAARDGFVGLIGDTPLVYLHSLSRLTGCDIYAKAEFLNPGGSSKDRIAKQIVLDAEAAGLLRPGGTIVEGTSGSTGISLALVARARGYRCTIVMPDDQAAEKQQLLRKFGASVVLVKPSAIVNDEHYCNVARRLAAGTEGGFFADQFETLSNYRAHLTTTGPEIWRQTGGKVDAFVMAAGTGGTIAGVSCFLKQQRPSVRVYLIDPPGSSLYHRVKHGVAFTPQQAERRLQRHRYDTITEGIGIDRLTRNFAHAEIDGALKGTDKEAVEMSRFLLREEGLFVGSSSALNCVGAVLVARMLGPGHTIVTLLCDSGHRHLTKFWDDEFVAAHGLTASATGLEFIAAR